MPARLILVVCSTALFFSGCGEETAPAEKKIIVNNTMNVARSFETVSVAIDSLDLEGMVDTEGDSESIVIVDAATGNPVVSQTIDSDGDGRADMVLFQPEIKAESEKTFTAARGKSNSNSGSGSDTAATASTSGSDTTATTSASQDSISRVYSRFVPERTDDYAWENDKVAFRTYGPTAQKMVEDGEDGGTLSSGIDAWLKRVDYPIIDKWYKKELETDGSYHEDTGEGLDSFHVGISRGVGGIAVKEGDTFHRSKNFTSWETLYNGPIRTSFVLTYADWDASGNQISEEKHISLDYGSNLSKFEIAIEGTDTIAAGLTLHDNEGTTGVGEQNWISYWEPHDESELGTGIVVPDGNMAGHEKFETEEKDLSNIYANVEVNEDGKAIYYAGFGWKKSGQFETRAEWESYLSGFSEKLKNPLVVEIR